MLFFIGDLVNVVGDETKLERIIGVDYTRHNILYLTENLWTGEVTARKYNEISYLPEEFEYC